MEKMEKFYMKLKENITDETAFIKNLHQKIEAQLCVCVCV